MTMLNFLSQVSQVNMCETEFLIKKERLSRMEIKFGSALSIFSVKKQCTTLTIL